MIGYNNEHLRGKNIYWHDFSAFVNILNIQELRRAIIVPLQVVYFTFLDSMTSLRHVFHFLVCKMFSVGGSSALEATPEILFCLLMLAYACFLTA